MQVVVYLVDASVIDQTVLHDVMLRSWHSSSLEVRQVGFSEQSLAMSSLVRIYMKALVTFVANLEVAGLDLDSASTAGGQIWRRMQLIVLGKNSPVICSLLAHCYELWCPCPKICCYAPQSLDLHGQCSLTSSISSDYAIIDNCIACLHFFPSLVFMPYLLPIKSSFYIS
jgi:hypothetical protein